MLPCSNLAEYFADHFGKGIVAAGNLVRMGAWCVEHKCWCLSRLGPPASSLCATAVCREEGVAEHLCFCATHRLPSSACSTSSAGLEVCSRRS